MAMGLYDTVCPHVVVYKEFQWVFMILFVLMVQ